MQTNLEQCPLCGTELSQTKFREIRAKLRLEQEQKNREMEEAKLAVKREAEQEFKKKLEQESRAAEKRARAEADKQVRKAIGERDTLAEKLKTAEAEAVEIRKDAQEEVEKQRQAAQKTARAEAAAQVQKLTSERDLASKKLKESEAREAEIRKQVQEHAEKQRQKDLIDQRQALDKANKLALLKQQAEFNRERESYRKKTQLLESQLQRKTANELGDGGEIDVFEAVRDSFDGSTGKTTRIPKGQAGADLLHEVFHKGDSCGRIIIDAKNRQAWQNAFVTKLRQDQIEAGAEHAILATTVFPSGKKEMCIESGVIVISPARVVHIVQLLRQAMITMHIKGLSVKERTGKMNRLYELITSEAYSAKFTEANRLTDDMLELEVQEKTAHDNVWKKRGALVKRMHNILREVETDVAAVIEGDGNAGQPLPIFDNKGAAIGTSN